MHKTLIVEDDETIASTLSRHLAKWDYEAESVTDFENVLTKFISFEPQLVMLDITLPFFSGYHWCNEIRKISKVPIIFISSACDNMNIVMAMNMGGDDFISKPFDVNVLVAKIGAVIRRTYSFGGSMNVIERNGAVLNIGDATLTAGSSKIELSKNEFRILQTLFENAGKVVSRDTIMMKLWESDNFIDDNTLTVNVTRIRKRLEEIGLAGFITTKKGIGYMVE